MAAAVNVAVTAKNLRVELDDGRTIEIALDGVPWLRWLARASERARDNWVLEPGGFAVYWPDLDDGVEVCHLLSQSLLS